MNKITNCKKFNGQKTKKTYLKFFEVVLDDLADCL